MFVVKKKLAWTPQEKPLLATNIHLMKAQEWPFFAMSDMDSAVLTPISTGKVRIGEEKMGNWEGSLKTVVFLARSTQLLCFCVFVA